ncbi:MAG TPA: DUF2314 domain-containing protein [Tepidisphaeraceae bacterium]|jgi:uncharacterized protein YegJ (DUF2314 family)
MKFRLWRKGWLLALAGAMLLGAGGGYAYLRYRLEPKETLPPMPMDIADDDPALAAATAEAKRRWPEFAAAYAARASRKDDDEFLVKALFSEGDIREVMWVEVEKIENGTITGQLMDDPEDLKNLKEGDSVQVKEQEIQDWRYTDSFGDHGAFSEKVLDKKRKAGQ